MAELHTPPVSATPGSDQPVRIDEIGMDGLDVIRRLNRAVFDEERVINTFDHCDLVMLVASLEGEAAGFKIGYRLSEAVYYSAKGGVLPAFRERGVARALLEALMDRARQRGFQRFAYDTFPNKHPGMAVMGLRRGFRVTRADYNARYQDYRLRLEKEL